MNLPKKVKIGAHTFVIKEVADHFDGEDIGRCDLEGCKIFIKKGLSDTHKLSTLMHEAMHAMNTTIEHDLLDSLSEQITQFLMDNKLLK